MKAKSPPTPTAVTTAEVRARAGGIVERRGVAGDEARGLGDLVAIAARPRTSRPMVIVKTRRRKCVRVLTTVLSEVQMNVLSWATE
ncbi:hypothetical protein [Streptomyces zaomyceticus]|uniref:hypothetical protein n=1 Tax=Streptomyces zaomyceticus TaxID=68286 RepID=UPI002E15F6F1|nr:hypothetical protein OG237_01360 [Streptomyces zaomyceticus]